MYAAIAGSGQSSAERINIFNGNYGLHRGLAAALLMALGIVVVQGVASWWNIGLLLAATGLCLARMDRFGCHYARELFVQFLNLPAKGPERTINAPAQPK
jgi:hypothetical protein